MKKINKIINLFFEIMKWPVAVLMILAVVPALYTDMYVFEKLTNSDVLIQFFLPFAATVFLFLFMPGLAGSFFAIMEHELTHMLFAVLTLHKPKGLDVNQDVGGSFSFEGKGNWLIALAPYFFPTFWFFIVLLTPLYMKITGLEKLPDFYMVLLAVFAGYNFIVTCLSIHPKQTDFKVAGVLFTILFLPGITLLKYGLVFCYSVMGWKGILGYSQLFLNRCESILHALF